MWQRFITNHVLANLTFLLVLAVGLLSYQGLPRQQDPTINFNWIIVTTPLPGATALDVESKVTDPLEDALRSLADVKFVSSNSREGISSILVRFDDIDERTFDKRLADLRREIQNTESELPDAALDSLILEITSSNAFPAATVAVTSLADDENLRLQASRIDKDLSQLKGVARIDSVALPDPELQVNIDVAELEALGISPQQVANTVAAFFQDEAAGNLVQGDRNWLVRVVGTASDPTYLANRPILGAAGEVSLSRVASVERAREDSSFLVRVGDKPSVLLAVMKKEGANTLELVERVQGYMDDRNALSQETGVEMVLIDDQTIATRKSIEIMENNALIGLILVLVVAWFFLGTRISMLTAIGIPFILAATFWVLAGLGETLNVTVLLGVVIVLGMLVDDAVVVVESIYYRLQRGFSGIAAVQGSIKEVAAPVTAAVLTTIAAFLPLMLLPGILGKFMKVIPMVVSIALAISLIEAFWMLPAHILAAKVGFEKPSRIQRIRESLTHRMQITYVRLLIKAFRRPVLSLIIAVLPLIGAIGALGNGYIKMDFFAADPVRLFYVNVEMPAATPVEKTMEAVSRVEARVRQNVREGEVRAIASYAGQMFTETEPRIGEQYGQILVGLNPKTPDLRTVEEMTDAVREDIGDVAGPIRISFLRLSGGPPASKPISVKVRGDDYQEIRDATNILIEILNSHEDFVDVEDDAARGRYELSLELDSDAINRSGLNPADVRRTLRLLVDGEVVASMRDSGERLDVRVRANPDSLPSLERLLSYRIPVPAGGAIPLSELVIEERKQSLGNIRHYNFRRAITLEADLRSGGMDTVQANAFLLERWKEYEEQYPAIDLDFSGELDDIKESMDSIAILFLVGVGLMYLILGTQFRSYWQPLMILATVPLAFTGVVLGLIVTQNPLSLYTMYGVVALAGIAVNAAIVLISAANDRIGNGMSLMHATLYASRRRVIPVLITTLTTMAGLFSLAAGLGGKSLIWGPVATSIVWGLGFSSVLTLFVIPLIYRLSMRRAAKRLAES
ncbi:efflux RND transporter permease subunit [Marinobacterium sp. LSUCC0821]|uniref:efflux RND transporter permease subunit n=1 Tax=Marinobacterium sp. LSUCC0821 TaxID=2668067 RepID=UPI001452368E|nr:efflux RND transporter permease subunit [Marinobacterium sp. LSUCC0821]QJD71678.1 efflux RND transporter permease subunit [Marinobacterium sp. LSUCC0821]